MSPCFHKTYWHIVGPRVITAIQHFFQHDHILKAINHILLAFLPKKASSFKVDHFRPISLCNLDYKSATKIISNRLKYLLDRIISPIQFAFIPNRGMSDNIIISHVIMHHLNKKET